jgi:hypothetical protein
MTKASRGGRPTIYTPELADLICERLANGESLAEICADRSMPGLRTVVRWAAENEGFGAEYARAREAQAEVMDAKILATADEAGKDPAAARVKIGAYQWRAAKLAPKRYSERQVLAGDPEAPLFPETGNIDCGETLVALLGVALARRETALREGLTGRLSSEQFDYLVAKHPSPPPVPLRTHRERWSPAHTMIDAKPIDRHDGSDLA